MLDISIISPRFTTRQGIIPIFFAVVVAAVETVVNRDEFSVVVSVK